MRPRAVGGLEPDDTDQAVLVEFWHVSRVFGLDRQVRLDWVVDHFLAIHPEVARKWVYVWCERYLGRLVEPDPVEPAGWVRRPDHCRTCKRRAKVKRRPKQESCQEIVRFSVALASPNDYYGFIQWLD